MCLLLQKNSCFSRREEQIYVVVIIFQKKKNEGHLTILTSYIIETDDFIL